MMAGGSTGKGTKMARVPYWAKSTFSACCAGTRQANTHGHINYMHSCDHPAENTALTPEEESSSSG